MSIWNRQQYLDLMQFKPVPRPFFAELFGPLVGLEEEWQAQGAGPTELDLSTFGFDGVQRRRVPIYTGIFPWRQKRVISESDTELIQEDHYGRRMKLCKGFATIPLPQSHPVADMDDWMGLRDRYCFHAGRLEPDWDQPVAADTMSVLYIPGGFDEPRQLLGEEELCCAVYEQPELIHDMLTVIGDQIVLVLQRLIQAGVRVDQISIHEDMAGKSGPLFGPTQIETFLQSYYQRVWTHAGGGGATLQPGFRWRHAPGHRRLQALRRKRDVPLRAGSGHGYHHDPRRAWQQPGPGWRYRQACAPTGPTGHRR